MPESPISALEHLADQRVRLRLKDGRELEGRLIGLDEHLNLALDDAGESAADLQRHLGRVVVRGSSVVSLHAPSASAARAKSR